MSDSFTVLPEGTDAVHARQAFGPAPTAHQKKVAKVYEKVDKKPSDAAKKLADKKSIVVTSSSAADTFVVTPARPRRLAPLSQPATQDKTTTPEVPPSTPVSAKPAPI